MDRINKEEYYCGIAKTVALRSTCLRRRYGAVIVNNDEIVATGYNGAPRGEMNCIDCGFCKREELGIPKGERYELCLAGNTLVCIPGRNEPVRFEDLANGAENFEFKVYSVSQNDGKVHEAYGLAVRKTGYEEIITVISFANGGTLRCTADHKIMMLDGSYKAAESLIPGDVVRIDGGGLVVKNVRCSFFDNDVYDLTVPGYHNFAVDVNGAKVFVHNCVSVHAEANAIISAARRDMLGGTIYIAGLEKDGRFANPAPCIMCRRLIRNAGIKKCIGFVNGVPTEISLEPENG